MKKIIYAILCFVILFGFSGCSNNSKNTDKEDINKTKETDKLVETNTNSQKAIGIKEEIPNPKDYIDTEYISSEEFNGETAYTYYIDNCVDKVFYDKYVTACKEAGFTVNPDENNDSDLNTYYYSGRLDTDTSRKVEIWLNLDSTYTRIIAIHSGK